MSGTEFNGTSTDERISKEDDLSDSYVCDDDIHTRPEQIEKGGGSWSTHRTTVPGRNRAINIMKTKSGSVIAIQIRLNGENLIAFNWRHPSDY